MFTSPQFCWMLKYPSASPSGLQPYCTTRSCFNYVRHTGSHCRGCALRATIAFPSCLANCTSKHCANSRCHLRINEHDGEVPCVVPLNSGSGTGGGRDERTKYTKQKLATLDAILGAAGSVAHRHLAQVGLAKRCSSSLTSLVHPAKAKKRLAPAVSEKKPWNAPWKMVTSDAQVFVSGSNRLHHSGAR